MSGSKRLFFFYLYVALMSSAFVCECSTSLHSQDQDIISLVEKKIKNLIKEIKYKSTLYKKKLKEYGKKVKLLRKYTECHSSEGSEFFKANKNKESILKKIKENQNKADKIYKEIESLDPEVVDYDAKIKKLEREYDHLMERINSDQKKYENVVKEISTLRKKYMTSEVQKYSDDGGSSPGCKKRKKKSARYVKKLEKERKNLEKELNDIKKQIKEFANYLRITKNLLKKLKIAKQSK